MTAVPLELLVLVLGILLLLCLAALVWLLVRLRRLERHYGILTSGVNAADLRTTLEEHIGRVQAAEARVRELDGLVMQLERQSRIHLQRTGFLRFNPFRDSGGDQSFALTLADDEGRGVVVSSLHGRDGTRVYAKPLAGWQSPYPLTDEEQVVIRKAQGSA